MLFEENFPRKLNEEEVKLFTSLLPAGRPGYAEYREFLSKAFVTGYGYQGNESVIISEDKSASPAGYNSLPVLTYGKIESGGAILHAVIHEEEYGYSELGLSVEAGPGLPEKVSTDSVKSMAFWKPGKPDPLQNKPLREVHVIKNELVIAVSDELKRVWAFDNKSGMNYIIPVTIFYGEVLRVKGIRDPKIALKPDNLFKSDMFTDKEIGQGFLLYNKFWKKIELDYTIFDEKDEDEKKKSIWKIFSRRRGNGV